MIKLSYKPERRHMTTRKDGDQKEEYLVEKFNLQLFADVTNKTTSASTGNNLSAENKTFYDKELIKMAGPNLVYSQFAQKRNIPKNGGKTIEFRKFKPLAKATTPLTEGVTPDGQALNIASATVGRYGGFVRITDLLDLTAIDPIMTETVDLIGDQAGRTVDTLDQRSTIGWKALLTTKILVDEYMVRVETCSSFNSDAN